jgi:hypothetical protein
MDADIAREAGGKLEAGGPSGKLDAGAPIGRPASRWRRVALPLLCVVVPSHAADSRTVARLDASVRPSGECARFARRDPGGPRLELGTPPPRRKLAPSDVKTFGEEPFYDVDVKADGRKLNSVEAFNPSALEAFFRQRREYLLQ